MLKIVPNPEPATGWVDIIPDGEPLLNHIRYAHIRLEPGQRYDGDSAGCELAMIVTRGPVDFRCDRFHAPAVGDRSSMFEGPPTGLYVPPHSRFEITGGDRRGGELSVLRVRSERKGAAFVVQSDERLAFERAQREKAMASVRADLEALAERVRRGRIKAPEKVGAAAARILGRRHGHRYYDWEYKNGKFRFFEHPVRLAREKAYEGKYVIQTEESDLSPVQAVQLYKELSEVERAFSSLKDVIEMRPIYHQTDERVAAHIFVAAMALLLHRALERKLKKAGLDLSATEALQVLRTVRVVDFELGPAQLKRSVTRGTARAARILRALGIRKLDPPTPPVGKATIM